MCIRDRDDAMANATAAASEVYFDRSAVFVVLNGMNSGGWFWLVPGCIGTLASDAADALAPERSKKRALYLYTMAGRPVRKQEHVTRGSNMLQLVLEGEAWVWGGVMPGFSWRIGRRQDGQQVVLTTLSLTPKVLSVSHLLTQGTMDSLMAAGSRRMSSSPQKHYAAGFENYRTSKTAFLHQDTGASSLVVRETGQMVARLAHPSHVEWPQLLKYDPGDWYKGHHDYFHNYKPPNGAVATTVVRWIQWVRERVDPTDWGERDPSLLADLLAADSDPFQLRLVGLLLEYDTEAIGHPDWINWLETLSLIHISEPTRLLSISYAVFCLKKKKKIKQSHETKIMISKKNNKRV
eukprot:TRINITY_DN22750_c0_g1_i1.p1 TRINITY_DN22750_c0_g1~~TRINITY_DN22750_c0_g1_i1.p1  ORF type:complete len:350 (-),score=75.03 TRINITY_DN22750_c0_g1_i1:65-1114(-)